MIKFIADQLTILAILCFLVITFLGSEYIDITKPEGFYSGLVCSILTVVILMFKYFTRVNKHIELEVTNFKRGL